MSDQTKTTEPVRLVIWDLDDTFWRGTLSEGGIEAYVQEHHDIVVELARRGIMSSICSKNDFETVRTVLQDKGLWDYFVFPSIDWSPKGARIARLIEAMQLRPQSVLFLDDEPTNRAEAEAAAPGLSGDGSERIATLLSDPLLSGKDDAGLSRLAQYKLLQQRKADEAAAPGGDNAAFLRGCDIHVTIDTDIERHLDRAVELIQRTNQLNFTKLRLPEDPAEATSQLSQHVSQYFVQAGLVRVRDRYGDYGYCGFFSKHNDNNDIRGRLVHFCFSCRILGMGVEHWIYDKLGRPPIHLDGKILTDLGSERAVDWITYDRVWSPPAECTPGDAIPEIRFRGGCDVTALAHYFKLSGHVTLLESNYKKNAFTFMRKDFSDLLLNTLRRDAAMQRACETVGFDADDVRSGFFAEMPAGSLLVYSGWGDIDYPLYRHREQGFRIPCPIEILKSVDATRLTEREVEAFLSPKGFDAETRTEFHGALAQLKAQFEFDGLLSAEAMATNLHEIFTCVPEGATLAVLLAHEYELSAGALLPRPRARMYNDAVRTEAESFANVMVIDIADTLHDPADKQEGADHFHRVVYERLFQMIMTRRQALPPPAR